MPSRRLALLLMLVCLGAALGHAAEPPDNVAQAITDAIQSCKDEDGKPNAELRVEHAGCE